MSLALCKSPVGATASRPHRGQQFLCRSPQMIRMIHWYRNPKQLGPGSAEASWTESCLVLSEIAASHYGFLSWSAKPAIRSYCSKRFLFNQAASVLTSVQHKTDDGPVVLLLIYVQVAV